MNLYERFLLPSLVTGACSCSPIEKQRQKIASAAEGVVLELGFGVGLNLQHYDAAKVRKLYALETSPGMVKRAQKRVRDARFEVEIYVDATRQVRDLRDVRRRLKGRSCRNRRVDRTGCHQAGCRSDLFTRRNC